MAAISAPQTTGRATIVGKSDHFATDHLENLYVVQGQTITRFNGKGLQMSQFTWTGYDAIDHTDPADPFKILIFNRSSGTVMRLNNQLATLSNPWNLSSLGLFSPLVVCNSWDNGAWIYDQSLHELVRLDHSGTIDQRSGSLGKHFPQGTEISMIREQDFRIYLAAPELGILVFDRYANFLKKITLEGLKTFQINQNKILFSTDSTFVTFNMQTLDRSSLSLPGIYPAGAQLQGNTLFVRYADSIIIQPVIFNK
jgi:hypothetical protein